MQLSDILHNLYSVGISVYKLKDVHVKLHT